MTEQRPVDFVFAGRREAIATATCRRCKEAATDFVDDLSRREYELSGFCQRCQDWVFTDDGA